MGMFLTVLSGVCKLIGLADWAAKLEQSAADRKVGGIIQENADHRATIKDANDAQEIREDVQKLSDVDLDAALGGRMRTSDGRVTKSDTNS